MRNDRETLDRLIGRLQARPGNGNPTTGGEGDGDLEPLLQAALALKEVADVTPSPARVARIRVALHATRPPIRSGTMSWWLVRRAALAVAMIAALLASSATVYASGDALPGSPLYGIRQVREGAQLTWTRSPSERTALSLDFALVRARQLHQQASSGASMPPDALATLLHDILNLVTQAGRESRADGATARGTMQRERSQITQQLLDAKQQGQFSEAEAQKLTQTIDSIEKVEPVEVEGSDG